MRVSDRTKERFSATSGQLMFNGFGDETAPIPLEAIDLLDQLS
jgi:hypothetical protein